MNISKDKKILIIVESPNKVTTIKNILKKAGYSNISVAASVGHIMELANGGSYHNSGIEPTKEFELNLKIAEDKHKVVQNLKEQVKNSDIVYIMSDGDREGEVIAWSLVKFLKIAKTKYYRAITHEITPAAVIKALENPIKLSEELVNAGLARMTLDKMVGFTVSPIAKNYIGAKSVGRCQSAGLKLIVDREQEIRDFIPEKYYNLYLNFEKNNSKFKAKYIGTPETTIDKLENIEQVKIENQLVPVEDENGYWTFTTDRDFKVLHLTDIHIGAGWMCHGKDLKALNAVAAMVTAEKPDLVIVTGDIAYPVPPQAGTDDNLASAKMFANLMEKLGVYWTVTFGNHDTEIYSDYDRAEIAEFYENGGFKYCLFKSGPEDVDGYGNNIINIKNSKGEITQSIFTFDSHSYLRHDILGFGHGYENIRESQVEWYRNCVEELTAYNKSVSDLKNPVPSSTAFFHIPLTEYQDAWYEYVKNDFKDTENVKFLVLFVSF